MSARPKILFLCRGSARDGIGHVIRSRTAARAMREAAEVRLVAVGDDYAGNLLVDRGLEYDVLSQTADVLPLAKGFEPDAIVFDLMYFDKSEFLDLASSAMTVSLSPIFNCLSNVDLLFHRTSVPDESWSAGGDKPSIRTPSK